MTPFATRYPRNALCSLVEVIVGVLAQLEERERVVTVATDEVDGRSALTRSGQLPGSAQRPEEEIGEQEHSQAPGGADHQRQPLELVVELQRGGVPGKHAARRDGDRSDHDEHGRGPSERPMADAEGAAPPPQQRRRRPAQDRLLEVEALEQRDRRRARSASPSASCHARRLRARR